MRTSQRAGAARTMSSTAASKTLAVTIVCGRSRANSAATLRAASRDGGPSSLPHRIATASTPVDGWEDEGGASALVGQPKSVRRVA